MKGNTPQRLLILVGPTGVGKTEIGFRLAKNLSGEIISADSRLIYRMMDIGTAKPGRRMRNEIPHHMIDIVNPDEEYTCKRFEEEAREAIRGSLIRKVLPVVVGGSGLYIKALTDGVFDGPGSNVTIRKKLRKEARNVGSSVLWQRLRSVDPDKARQIDPANVVRLVRALEVYEITGMPMSELERHAKPFEIASVKFGLTRSMGELYPIVEDRVDRMIDLGFLDEIEHLMSAGYGDAPPVRRSLGYRELIDHIEGTYTLEEAVRLIKRNTRHLAKRQMTWFRKDKEIAWIDITGRHDYGKIAAEITNRFQGR